MYQKVRIAVAALVVMFVCIMSSTGTLSYFTDSDVKTNKFLVGNASTELEIYDNITSGEEHEFDVGNYILIDGANIPIYLRARNDGNIPVYQRFRVVIPVALAGKVTLEFVEGTCEVTVSDDCSDADYAVIYNPSVMIENVPTYAEYYIVNNTVLDVDETTQDVPVVNLKTNGITEEDKAAFVCDSNDANQCMLDISIYSDAIQAAGFADGAVEAFEHFTETYNY